MRPDPKLHLPPPGQGFPLLPGRKEELVTIEKGEGDGEVNSIRNNRKADRRSKVKHKYNSVNLKIIHSNTDGYKSKKESINEIAINEKPDVFLLNDTNLKGNIKVKVPGYFSYNKNRDKHKGGVSTAVANHLVHNTMKVAEGTDEDEYIITRIDKTIPAVNIVNIYGTQESRSTNDEIEKTWYRLMKDVKDIESRNEAVIIIGDMNRHVGTGEHGINGNKNFVSNGGQLIRNLI